LFSQNITNPKIKMEENLPNQFSNLKITSINKTDSEIERIVIFFTNGTFKTYSSE